MCPHMLASGSATPSNSDTGNRIKLVRVDSETLTLRRRRPVLGDVAGRDIIEVFFFSSSRNALS